MTAIALLSVAPVIEGSMSGEVAKAVAALDDFDVSYETNPMGTVIEADDAETLFGGGRGRSRRRRRRPRLHGLKIDDKRTEDTTAARKVEAVEEHLGREAKRER